MPVDKGTATYIQLDDGGATLACSCGSSLFEIYVSEDGQVTALCPICKAVEVLRW